MKTRYFFKSLFIIGLLLIGIGFVIHPVSAYYYNLYDYYDTNDDTGILFYGNTWKAQYLGTIDSPDGLGYYMTRLGVKISRTGTPSEVTIRVGMCRYDPINAEWDPDKLCSNQISFSPTVGDIGTTAGWMYYDINLYIIEGRQYYIMINCTGDSSNYIRWRADQSSPTGDGAVYSSADGGITWSGDAAKDFMYRVYGETIYNTSFNVVEDLTDCTGTTEYNYNYVSGANVWVNMSSTVNCPSDITFYENLVNCTGTHEYTITDSNIYVWNNYSSYLNLIQNIVDATGTHEVSYSLGTYTVWANYTGEGGGCSFPFYFNYSDENITINVTVNDCEDVELSNSSVNETGWIKFGVIELDGDQFSIVITLMLFFFFFSVGYKENKRSGGALMILSGFCLLSFEALTVLILSSFFILPLLTPISIFILLLGVRKWLYPFEGEKTKSEGQ